MAVAGFEGRYDVSNKGRIRRSHGGMDVLKPTLTTRGYLTIGLLDADGVRSTKTVHSLVARAFLGPRPTGLIINHKDAKKTNNEEANLEYVTTAETLATRRP